MELTLTADTWFKKASRLNGLAIGLIALPVVCFYVLLLYTVDVPLVDDIETFLRLQTPLLNGVMVQPSPNDPYRYWGAI